MAQLVKVSDLANNAEWMDKVNFRYDCEFEVTAIYGSNGAGSYLVQMCSTEDHSLVPNVEILSGNTLLAITTA
jgi:ABC-type enterochelin transport system ATPase subunit